jgi:TRAP-type C4-dicarboxylate transport system substrate-binding protein
MFRNKSFIIALALASSLAGAISAQTPITLQIGAAVPANSPWDQGLRRLAAEWSRISGGKVRIAFPRAMANASQDDMLQKLRFTLDGALLDTTGLHMVDSNVLLLSMPSVVRNDGEFDAAAAVALDLLKQSAGDRYEFLAIAQGGWIHFFANKSLRTPEDFLALRIGVNQNQELLVRQLQAMGMRTVKADTSTILLQFNSNALDVVYTSPLYIGTLWSQFKRSVSSMSSFKVAPFFGAIVINKRSWERVPESLRPALIEATDRIVKEIARDSRMLEDEAIASMTKDGLTVPAMSADQAKAWDALFSGPQVSAFLRESFSPLWYDAVFKAVEALRSR